MSGNDRFEELSALIAKQRVVVRDLYDAWDAACATLNNFECEQRPLFRAMMGGSAPVASQPEKSHGR